MIDLHTKTVKNDHPAWDFRVMADHSAGDVNFEIHKMYYDQEGNEKMYNAFPMVTGGSEIKTVCFIHIVKAASRKPILWKGDRFPEVYEITPD